MKKAYLATFGGDDRGGNTNFGAVCEDDATAKLVAKGRGVFGGDNTTREVLIVEENGTLFMLGQWGLINGKPRKFEILEAGASPERIVDFLTEQKELEEFSQLRSNLSERDIELVLKYCK